tara:strand:- start:1372 stop:1797 length:426 start_codon:yes stop_codon:yes gene_type:complete
MRSDDNVKQVLKDDGIKDSILEPGHKYENLKKSNINFLEEQTNFKDSWAMRVVYNTRFAGVIIKQNPGEGNRMHYHPDADECWVILEGQYRWSIDGEEQEVSVGDIVVVKEKTWHQITVIGDKPAARLAITKPDVDHIYED